MLRKLKLAGLLAAIAVALSACRDSLPQSSLNPAGPVAQKQAGLFILVFWIAALVFVLVEGALVFFIWKYRHREGRRAIQSHGNTALEITLTIIPAVILASLAIPTVMGIWELAARPTGPDVLHVDVVGHQWWWEFRYTDLDIVTANNLVIPEDTQVAIRLCSAGATGPVALPKPGDPAPVLDGTVSIPDGAGPAIGQPCLESPPAVGNAVIHAFWVPRLAGKQDVMPGATNEMYLSADTPGVYPGQCAEYCAWSHANMRFEVEAKTGTDFDSWVAAQQTDASAATADLAMKGASDFASGACIGCHTVRGLTTDTGGAVAGVGGPDLTHFASRTCFAGCIFPIYNPDGSFNAEAVKTWLHDPAAVKPGSKMPDYKLTDDQINELVAYLETLK